LGTVLFRRPPRQPGPVLPRGEIVLESPPELPSQVSAGGRWAWQVLPLLTGAGAVALLYAGRGGGATVWVIAGLFGVSLLAMAFGTVAIGPPRRAGIDPERRDYLRYLAQVRRRVRRAAEQQHAAMLWRHPAPDALWSIAASRRLWERRAGDEDFGQLRIAVGAQQPAVPLVAPETRPVEDLEPVSAVALRRFVRAHGSVGPLPIALALRAFGRVALRGDRVPVLDLARALLAQLVTFHSPEDMWLAVVATPERQPYWDWVKWLPHAQHPDRSDAAGALRLVSGSLAGLEALLADELAGRARFDPSADPVVTGPHLVVVLDVRETPATGRLTGPGLRGTTVLDLSGSVPREAGRWLLALDVGADRIEVDQGSRVTPLGTPDRMPLPVAEALARQLSAYRPARTSTAQTLTRPAGLPELLGIADAAAVDPDRTWQARPTRELLRIPIGTGPDGGEVWLDLKESALDGMGPHGLVVGAPGSGKTELLRAMLAALAVSHDPATLNFLLVDGKGSSTFGPLEALPHTSGVIRPYAEDGLVDRLREAVTGELVRRQELLRSAGGYATHREYERARLAGTPLSPLPALLVVCDEFSDLLSVHPDFVEVLVTIGRVGRSLGVHLLLASLRLEEGRLRGLETHLSYRIGLRTFSALESRIVLGVPDAYELPPVPGHGYLRADSVTMLRFRAPHVSGPYTPPRRPEPTALRRLVVPYGVDPVPVLPEPVLPEPVDAASLPEPASPPTTLEVIVARLRGRGTPAHPVWLPPLREPATLDQLLPGLVSDPGRGLHPAGWPGLGRLAAPVGVVDRPFEQRRDPLVVELGGAAGNVAVVGRPRSGKSTLLRTLVAALALTHTPAEAQFRCLDFGGGTLHGLAGLPHVAGVAAPGEAEAARGLVAEAAHLLAEREAGLAYGDLFLVVDGWRALREEHGDLADQLVPIAVRGPGSGIHLVVTANRWTDLPPRLRAASGTRLELRLGDPAESEVDRRAARNVPPDRPGRGLLADKAHFLSALPRIDGRGDPATLTEGTADLVGRVRAAGSPGGAQRTAG
jgi:DNA segregation ATPase FtsK/SpoIIIE, S-DNA-T family